MFNPLTFIDFFPETRVVEDEIYYQFQGSAENKKKYQTFFSRKQNSPSLLSHFFRNLIWLQIRRIKYYGKDVKPEKMTTIFQFERPTSDTHEKAHRCAEDRAVTLVTSKNCHRPLKKTL